MGPQREAAGQLHHTIRGRGDSTTTMEGCGGGVETMGAGRAAASLSSPATVRMRAMSRDQRDGVGDAWNRGIAGEGRPTIRRFCRT
jgi:hypothetical protein